MSNQYQKITFIGKSCQLLKFVNIPLPPKIEEFGVENTVWNMTHFHVSANMKTLPPFHITNLAKDNPEIILAVTAGNYNGPHYRFLLCDKTHVPLDVCYTAECTFSPHNEWADNISPEEAWKMIRKNRNKNLPPKLSKKKALLPPNISFKKMTPVVSTFDLDQRIDEIMEELVAEKDD